MKSGVILLLLSAVLLSGCWSSKTRLMPTSEMVKLEISGSYNSTPKALGETITVKPLTMFEFEIRLLNENGATDIYTASFDRLDPAKFEQLAPWMLDDSSVFIAELKQDDEIIYTLLAANADESGKVRYFRHFQPICSNAVRRMIGTGTDGDIVCYFTRYSDVERAALDTVEWLKDDPRLIPSFQQFDRQM